MMDTSDGKLIWQRTWVFALALVSFLIPMAVLSLGLEPIESGQQQDYLRISVALLFGIIGAVIAFVSSVALQPIWLRWLSRILALCGVLISAYLLIALVGTCGAQVLAGVCQP